MRKILIANGPESHGFRPFFSIWRHSETTILKIAHDNPGYRLLAWPLLASLAASHFLMVTGFYDPDDGLYLGLFWGSLLAHGPVLEVLALFVGAWVLRVIGASFGGVGSSSDLQVVIAWCNVPVVCLVILQMLLWIPLGLLSEVASNGGAASAIRFMMTGTLACAELGAVAASIVILVRGVAAVHRVAWLTAFWTVLIGWLGAFVLLALTMAMLGGSRFVGAVVFGPLWGG